MKFKPNYIVIPLCTIVVAVTGSIFTNNGMDWYNSVLIRPEITPARWIFPIAWNVIFVLATISALILWNKGRENMLMALFAFNGILNVSWSLLFFQLHFIKASLYEMILLEISLVALVMLSWHTSKLASALLLPYTAWVAFATYLTYQVYLLNV